MAGHETTAVALTWAWYLLSTHPGVDARLASEIDALIGDRPVSLEDLPGFAYARTVFLETMRLYPPAWTTPRMAIAGQPLLCRRHRALHPAFGEFFSYL